MSVNSTQVIVAGTLDTKSTELHYLREFLVSQGVDALLVDLSTSGEQASADVTASTVASFHPEGSDAVFTGDRGKSVSAMAQAFERWIIAQPNIQGIIGAGGTGGTALLAPAMRALAFGIPKVLISTDRKAHV